MLASFRTLAFLRRIARALESLAESQREQTRLALEADRRREIATLPRERRPIEVGAFDPIEASRRFRKHKLAEGWTEEELEDEYGPLTSG